MSSAFDYYSETKTGFGFNLKPVLLNRIRPKIPSHNGNVNSTSGIRLYRWCLDHAMAYINLCRCISSNNVSHRLLSVCTTVVAFFERFSCSLITLHCVIYTDISLIPFHIQITSSKSNDFLEYSVSDAPIGRFPSTLF